MAPKNPQMPFLRDIGKERRAFARFVKRQQEGNEPVDYLSAYVSERVKPTGRNGRPVSPDAVVLRITSAADYIPEGALDALRKVSEVATPRMVKKRVHGLEQLKSEKAFTYTTPRASFDVSDVEPELPLVEERDTDPDPIAPRASQMELEAELDAQIEAITAQVSDSPLESHSEDALDHAEDECVDVTCVAHGYVNPTP
jgi:hypothetical protein